LGKATVQSSLGQGLKAEVQVNGATDSEAESLAVEVASAAAYAASNLDFSPALKGLKVALQKQGGGNAVIRITGDQPLNEPVLQILLDVRWSTGKMVRVFTLFIDPPAIADKNKPEAGLIIGAVPATVLVPEKIPPVVAPVAAEATVAVAEVPVAGTAEGPEFRLTLLEDLLR